jgi:FKBP-type peptidyl-prolyl cis-trans isomerase FkpA
MSATQVPLRPLKRGSMLKLWLGLGLLMAAAAALAWTGAGSLRGETTATGVQIRTLEEGKGDPIKATDGAVIDYEARLADGTVFDSTAGRGPAGMIPSQVIPGFGEALQRMREGGRYTIRIPSALGYGAAGAGDGKIPPNSELIFDVQVRQVVRDAALMVPPPGAQPQGAPGAPAPGQPGL